MYVVVGLFVESSKEYRNTYSRYRKEEYWTIYRQCLTWAHVLGGFILSLIPIINVVLMVIGLIMFIADVFKYLNTLHVYKTKGNQ